MIFSYLVTLFIALMCMVAIDRRYKLALFYNRRATLLLIAVMLIIFIAWDIVGIVAGVFMHGGSPWSLPFVIAPEFPFEELVFLVHLCYTTLIVYRIGERLWQRT